MSESILKSDLNLLNDRICNLSAGLATMPENGTTQVNKAFLNAVLGYMEELLGMRRTQPANDPLCEEGENFIQNKFGYCFYSLKSCPIIYNLYVQPQYRRHGCSKVLLGLVIGEIRKSGYMGEIGIQAEPRENSIELEDLTEYYKSLGLTVCETRKPEGSAEI